MIMLLALFLGEQNWEIELYQAALVCDLTAVEDQDGYGWSSPEAIVKLNGQVSWMLVPAQNGLSEMNQEAAHVLARYWADYYAQHNIQLVPFEAPSFDFFFESKSEAGQQRILGTRGRIFEPARPFANGSLLTFSPHQLWFSTTDGLLETYSLPFEASPTLAPFWLEAINASDSYVLGFLANRLGLDHVLVGKPHALSGLFQADSLKQLFDQILDREGYSFAKIPGNKLYVFRPGFADVDIEKALAQVSITDTMGLTAIVPTAAELTRQTMEEILQEPAAPSLLNNYGIRLVVDGVETPMLLGDTARVAKGLIQLSLQKNPQADADQLRQFIQRFLAEVVGHDLAARQMLKANLIPTFESWSDQSGPEQMRAKALTQVLAQDAAK
ncbi:MAG: hypothetical protein H6510_02235 [Acidobacteria bacterium]|nr:hypothetical protein [Acidobacteriota bacterium]MCB9396612.1 hypothetical protein [Acidobacteriota bacterium]